MDEKKNIFYVYEWFNTDTGEVFYVGKGKNSRYKNVRDRNEYFINYYNNHNCDVRKVKTDLSECQAFELEKQLIKKYREEGQAKCNFTDGGEGATFPKNSKQDLLRKLRNYHNIMGLMDFMDNEIEYDNRNLRNKTYEEIKDLYNKFNQHKRKIEANKDYYSLTRDKVEKFDAFNLKQQDDEVLFLIETMAKKIAAEYEEFSDLLDYETSYDFICCDFDTDKFFDIMFSDNDFYEKFLKIYLDNFMFLRNISYIPKRAIEPIGIKVRSTTFINRNILSIRFNTSYDERMMRAEINLYDLAWGVLMNKKKKPFFQLILEEVIVAPSYIC